MTCSLELASRLVQMLSSTGDTVLDPFCGTTMVAALKHGRNSLGVELDPAYSQQAASRLLHENTNLFGNRRADELKRGLRAERPGGSTVEYHPRRS